MIAEKPTVKTSWTILAREKKYGDTKPGEDKADSGGNNEFCLDNGIEWMTGEILCISTETRERGKVKNKKSVL